MQNFTISSPILAIIGLGNPGRQYTHNRHNIGFRVVDTLADTLHASWQTKDTMDLAQVTINDNKIYLIKPQTFMNSSGKVVPFLIKQGIKPENILVVHDELELPFGQLKFKMGGSHKGHNGLKSIIGVVGDMFARLRFGIGRPENREDVPDYVLRDFKENKDEVQNLIDQSAQQILNLYR